MTPAIIYVLIIHFFSAPQEVVVFATPDYTECMTVGTKIVATPGTRSVKDFTCPKTLLAPSKDKP